MFASNSCFKVPTIADFAQLLEVSEDCFHREIKKIIKMDFKKETKLMGIKNPDIGIDCDNNIVLVDPNNKYNHRYTNISIFNYI